MKSSKALFTLFLVLALLGSLFAFSAAAEEEEPVDPLLSLWKLGHGMGYQSMEKSADGIKFTEKQGATAAGSNSYIEWLGIEEGYVDFSKPVYFSFTINEIDSPAADAQETYPAWQNVFCFFTGMDNRFVTFNVAQTDSSGAAAVYTGTQYGNHVDIMKTRASIAGTYYFKYNLPEFEILYGETADESTWENIYPHTDAAFEGYASAAGATVEAVKKNLSFTNDGDTVMGNFASRTNFFADAENRGKMIYTFHDFNGTEMKVPALALKEGAADITIADNALAYDAKFQKKTLADLKALLELPDFGTVTFYNGATALQDTDELGQVTTISIANGDMETQMYLVTISNLFGTDISSGDESDNNESSGGTSEDDNPPAPSTGVPMAMAAVLMAGLSAAAVCLTVKKSKKQ